MCVVRSSVDCTNDKLIIHTSADYYHIQQCPRYAYPQKLHDMLTSVPDFNGRANFDECLEAELFVRYHAYTMYTIVYFSYL